MCDSSDGFEGDGFSRRHLSEQYFWGVGFWGEVWDLRGAGGAIEKSG